MRYSSICSLLIACLPVVIFPSTARTARGYYLQAGIGAAEQKTIHAIHPGLGSARTYSGELGMFVTEHAALGIRLSYQDNDVSGAHLNWDRLRIDRWEVNTNVYEAVAHASAWVPRHTGILVGAGAGISRFTSDTGISSAHRLATAPVFELFSGLQLTFENEFMVMCRIGYSYRDFGVVEARYGQRSFESIDLDLSGWFFEMSIGGHTNRPWSPAK